MSRWSYHLDQLAVDAAPSHIAIDERRRNRRKIILFLIGGLAMFGIVCAILLAVNAGSDKGSQATAADPQTAEDQILASVPAVVVKTVPEAGAEGVDSRLTEIKVSYSKNMQDGSWSWSTFSADTFPTLDGKPKYLADKRTCVLPVKLAPGKTYAIWLNSEKFGNFKDADGRSAVPYLLVFKTKK
jgi:Bacterial Ig-like domain